MPARLIQPQVHLQSARATSETGKLSLPAPVFHICYRYSHHASHSGYDQLCRYMGETLSITKPMHILGETLLRIPAKMISKWGGNFEYSRHDFVMEMQALLHMRRHRNSIYHFIYAEKSYKLLGRMANRNGNRFIGTFHHPPEHYPWLFRSTDHLRHMSFATAVSTSQVKFLEGIIGAGRVAFVPYGVNVDYFRPTSTPEAQRPRRCIFVGVHMRDFDRLPAIVDGVLQGFSNVEFVLVSRNPKCEMAVRPGRVRWLNRVTDHEYLNLMQNSDVLVLPMTGSTTVTSVLEAMACGVPVVTNQGGISDYLNEQCGALLPVGDVDGMVSTTLALLKNEDRRQAMGRAAREHALSLAWPNVAEKMRSIYERVAAEM